MQLNCVHRSRSKENLVGIWVTVKAGPQYPLVVVKGV